MRAPEFDLFKRIENLEAITKGGVTVKDAFIAGILSFEIGYTAVSLHYPQRARKYKDLFIARLEQMGFNEHWKKILEKDLLNLCEDLEKAAKQ